MGLEVLPGVGFWRDGLHFLYLYAYSYGQASTNLVPTREMPQRPAVVYALTDVFDRGRVYYIGVTVDLYLRFRSHLSTGTPRRDEPRFLRPERKNWTTWRHLRANLLPGLVVLEEHASEDLAYEAEKRLISLFRHLGHPMTNLSDGGPSAQLGREMAERARRRREAVKQAA